MECQWLYYRLPHVEILAVYPYLAAVSGMTFFITGSNYWGVGYLFGVLFFALALVLPFFPLPSPIAFGALWGVCLAITGFRLKRLARG